MPTTTRLERLQHFRGAHALLHHLTDRTLTPEVRTFLQQVAQPFVDALRFAVPDETPQHRDDDANAELRR